LYICVAVNSAWLNIELIYCNLKFQDPTEKHFGDVGILDKYEDNNNNNNLNTLEFTLHSVNEFSGYTLQFVYF
jgi:hypothetical protein